MLHEGGVAVKRPHDSQFRGHGLPRKAAVQLKAQKICFDLHTLYDNARDLIR